MMSNTNQKGSTMESFEDPSMENISEQMYEDLMRLSAAEDALAVALDMIAHPEVRETLVNVIADFTGAMMVGAINAMRKDMANAIAEAQASSVGFTISSN